MSVVSRDIGPLRAYAAPVPQPLGESAFWILTALTDGRQHGYAIMRAAAEVSSGSVGLKATTLYAALERLEADRLVEQDGDEVVEGRTRRYFRLTESGARRLQAEAEVLESKAAVARANLVRFRPVEGTP